MAAGRKLVSDTAAMAVGRFVQGASAFLALPFLARLLTPADFGLVTLAMSVVWVAISFSDAGFGQSLVRVDPEERDTWSSVFWLTTACAGALTLILLAIAGPAAAVMREPELKRLIVALAALPLVQGLMAVPMADLQRRRRFFTLAGADIATAALGFGMAIFLAARGAGAWALVGQQYFMLVGRALVVLAATRFRPRLRFRLLAIREHAAFAGHTVGYSVGAFLSQQADAIIIGRTLGASQLGLYGMAWRLMNVPIYILGGSLQRVMYPRMAAAADDPAALRGLVLASSLAAACLTFPAMAVLAVAHEALFHVLLSPRWTEASAVFAFLAPVGALQTVLTLNGALFMAVAQTGRRLRVTLEFAVLWLIALVATAHLGVVAVAGAYAAAYVAYLPRLLLLYLKPIGLSPLAFCRELAAPSLIAFAVAGLHLLLQELWSLAPLAELAVAAGEILVAYATLALVVRRPLLALRHTIKSAL